MPKSHKALKVALQRIEENSCLTFIKRTNESDYLSFFEGDGCFSSVGRLGGEQVRFILKILSFDHFDFLAI